MCHFEKRQTSHVVRFMPQSLNVASAWSSFDVLTRVADEDGLEVITAGVDGDIVWVGRREDYFHYLQYAKRTQLLNRIPGLGRACEKVATHEALNAGCSLPFVPRSWVYYGKNPEQLCDIVFKDLSADAILIVKPSRTSQGNGIVFVSGKDALLRSLQRIRRSLREIATGEYDLLRITDEAIIQQYIDPPMLLGGLKFDFRLYVLVCPAEDQHQAVEELGPAFLCREGLARFCTKAYASPTDSNSMSADAHLTNTSVSKSSEDFEATADPNDGRQGSKRKLSAVLSCLQQDGIVTLQSFWSSVEVIVTTVLRRMGATVYQFAVAKETYTIPPIADLDWQRCVRSAPGRFAQSFCLLGFDVMLNSQGEVFLLEVNGAPSLAIENVVPISGQHVDRSVKEASARKRWAVHHEAGVDFGQRCRCSGHFAPHYHELSHVDFQIKSTVVRGALQILQARERGDSDRHWAKGTDYSSLYGVPTQFL
eukprot:TRINITY_DN66440_c0_g1_i1.p1 TRINITY_DN66440_c0_g1~~TRINITY_DN66440_c0_g1_i1.p1  ORF type:complete len:480 (+),score=51.64 TRINITY_DN66440_c0_g1_i1:12-1451(+)